MLLLIKAFDLKALIYPVLFSMFFAACGQNNTNDKLIKIFEEDYTLIKADHVTKIIPNSIRSETLTENLQRMDFYLLQSKNIVHHDLNTFHLYVYTYPETQSSSKVLTKIIDLKKHREAISEYGPMGKGPNLFIKADNKIIHLEGFCDTIDENEWSKWKLELYEGCKKQFKSIVQIEKPCED